MVGDSEKERGGARKSVNEREVPRDSGRERGGFVMTRDSEKLREGVRGTMWARNSEKEREGVRGAV